MKLNESPRAQTTELESKTSKEVTCFEAYIHHRCHNYQSYCVRDGKGGLNRSVKYLTKQFAMMSAYTVYIIIHTNQQFQAYKLGSLCLNPSQVSNSAT